jgi:hypothetical protein
MVFNKKKNENLKTSEMKNIKAAYSSLHLLFAVIIFVFNYSGCASNGGTKETIIDIPSTVSEMPMAENKNHELKIDMNKLCKDHVARPRNVIFCLVNGLPGTERAVKLLMQNRVDIGNAVKPCYDNDAGNKLAELLKADITISSDPVKSAKAVNKTALDTANKKWYANADEISAFLSTANPNPPLADVQMMMNDHLKLTTDEADQMEKKDYDADVFAYDKVQNEILKMSAMLADGIINK